VSDRFSGGRDPFSIAERERINRRGVEAFYRNRAIREQCQKHEGVDAAEAIKRYHAGTLKSEVLKPLIAEYLSEGQ
jgi:hypothetical protein